MLRPSFGEDQRVAGGGRSCLPPRPCPAHPQPGTWRISRAGLPPTIAEVNRLTGITNFSAPLVYVLLSAFSASCLVLIINWRGGPPEVTGRLSRRWIAGYGAVSAAIDAGFTRFRPVLMTALAMVIGMLPMALSADQNAPLGRAVIGGLVFATVATLFFVPVVFALVHSRLRRHSASPPDGHAAPASAPDQPVHPMPSA